MRTSALNVLRFEHSVTLSQFVKLENTFQVIRLNVIAQLYPPEQLAMLAKATC